MDWATNFANPLIGGLPPVIQAIIILLIAWIVAAALRAALKKHLRWAFGKRVERVGGSTTAYDESVNILGNIVFAIVFILFLPGAFDLLGMTSISQPLASTAAIFFNFLPNIIAAIIVIAFGAFLAKLVEQLCNRGLKKTKLDSLQEKCGVHAKEGSGFSDIIAKIVYALILVVFVVAGIQILNISAISDPATSMVSQIFNIIPALFVAIILVAFGIFLANIVGNLLETVLLGTGFDQWARGFMPHKDGAEPTLSISHVINIVVKIVIDIIFVVAAIQIVNIQVLTDVGMAIIGYLPAILAAVLVLAIAWVCAEAASKAILKSNPKAAGVAFASKCGIIVIAVFMALSQLGVAPEIVNTLFLIAAGAIGVAFAISFGIGGRDFAQRTLENVSKNAEGQLECTKHDEPAESKADTK